MHFFKPSLPALSRPEKTALFVLAAILGSGAALRAWEHSGVELGPVKDWDTLRQKIVAARGQSDSAYPCAEPPASMAGTKWPERISDSSKGEEKLPKASPPPTAGKTPPAQPLSLNSVDALALEGLPGVGPATAKAIVDYRKAKGRFKRVSDLLEVKGIGPKKFAAMRPFLHVE